MSNIFNMFGPSPIRPLEKHMHKVHTCAKTLYPFMEAVIDNNWGDAETLHESIRQLENEADEMKKDLRLHLPSGLFLPVPRTDLLELLREQDKIANIAKDIAGLIIGRKMQLPKTVQALYMPFLKCCIEASKQACKAINELDELLETGFHGNEVHIVQEMITKLDALEHETDEMLIKIRQGIFTLESSLSPVDIIFLYKLVEWTGHLADSAQTVGGRLQLLLAR
jgi:hypothetical protein